MKLKDIFESVKLAKLHLNLKRRELDVAKAAISEYELTIEITDDLGAHNADSGSKPYVLTGTGEDLESFADGMQLKGFDFIDADNIEY